MKESTSEYSGKGFIIGLSPNMIETNFLENLDKRLIELNASEISMKMDVSKSEVVNGLEFLLFDLSSYTNGVNLNLTGGAECNY